MIVFTESEIDRLIEEDVPYFDLTTFVLGIGNEEGEITYSPRHEIVVCGTEECRRIIEKLGGKVLEFIPSGTLVPAGKVLLRAKGKVEVLHKIWKVTQNILEYASGIATITKNLVDLAKSVNPEVEIVTTRKTFPFSKKICIKGILAGGALPHRLGLSETILIFEQHLRFVGGLENFLERLSSIKRRVPEKKIAVEVNSVQEAFRALRAGVDVVQLDKFSVEDVKRVVEFKEANTPFAKVAAAGGINEQNIKLYASTGVDIIVLTCAYFGKPADIKVKIEPAK